ncbi:MAG: terminase large subunit [Pseudorhodoplanes sp.]|jgi:hypothetical protein|nr:terminase large subunit [Pseudorhodoplanes sp.]
MTIVEALSDPKLFSQWFRKPKTWTAWFAFLCALFALPMTAAQLEIYQQCTGRKLAPTKPAREAWLICGRRAGKSFILALCAVYLACFRSYREYLMPGERAMVLVIATDRKQARVIFRYVRAFVTLIPMLRKMIENENSDSFDLKNSVSIEVATASFRAVRGYAICAALLDEMAFFPTGDSAEPDTEILNAIRPGMAQFPNALLLCASSPYAKKGELYDAFRRYFGQDGEILIWHAATRTMNPSVPQRIIDEAIERDAAAARAEYLAEFRDDVESYISRDAILACVAKGVMERLPIAGHRYVAFVDPSGGSKDSMTVAIAHNEGGVARLDLMRERRAPFSPEAVVEDFCRDLKRYGIRKVRGDRYAGEWPREQFRKRGIEYELSDKPKSDIYRDVLPSINSRNADLLDSERLINQFTSLERRTGRGGKDSIDHPPQGHDDLCNAVAGVLDTVMTKPKTATAAIGHFQTTW